MFAMKTGNMLGKKLRDIVQSKRAKNNCIAQEIAIHSDKLNVGDSCAKAKAKAKNIKR